MMTFLVIIFAVSVVVFIAKLVVVLSVKQLQNQIENNMLAADIVVNSQKVPKDWILKAENNLVSKTLNFIGISYNPKKFLLKKISSLILFFEKSNVYENQETKLETLKLLNEHKEAWVQMDWPELSLKI